MVNTTIKCISKDMIKFPTHTTVDVDNNFKDKVICVDSLPKVPDPVKVLLIPMIALCVIGMVLGDILITLCGAFCAIPLIADFVRYGVAFKEAVKSDKICLNTRHWNNFVSINQTLSEIEDFKRYMHRLELRGVDYELYLDEDVFEIIVLAECYLGKECAKYMAKAFNVGRDSLGNIAVIDFGICDEIYEELIDEVKRLSLSKEA